MSLGLPSEASCRPLSQKLGASFGGDSIDSRPIEEFANELAAGPSIDEDAQSSRASEPGKSPVSSMNCTS